MCLAKVYEPEKDKGPILENVAHITISGDRVEMETLFGEKKVFQGKVRQVDFLQSRVHVERE